MNNELQLQEQGSRVEEKERKGFVCIHTEGQQLFVCGLVLLLLLLLLLLHCLSFCCLLTSFTHLLLNCIIGLVVIYLLTIRLVVCDGLIDSSPASQSRECSSSGSISCGLLT